MLSSRFFKSFILILVLATLMGCAHVRAVKSGDEFLERGDYRAALNSYRQAREKRPKSQNIQDKIHQAEEALYQELLHVLEASDSELGLDDRLSVVGQGLEWIEDEDRRESLKERMEGALIEEGRVRLGSKDFEGVLGLVDIYVATFGGASEDVETLEVLSRNGWLRELEELAEQYERDRRWGARALMLVQADYLAFDDRYKSLARNAVEKVLQEEGWAAHISGNLGDRELERVANAVFGADLPAAIVDGRRGDAPKRDVQIRFVRSEPIFDEWDELETRSGEYQSGTRLVSNPAYEREMENLYRTEERLAEAEMELNRAYRDARTAERNLNDRRRRGHNSSYEENRLRSAHRELDRREAQVESYRRDLERIHRDLRYIDQYLEEPVFSEHYYEVTLQNGRLRSSIRFDLILAERGFGSSAAQEVMVTEQSERHLPQPVLGLDGRREAKPTRGALAEALEESVEARLIEFVTEVFQEYRYEHFSEVDGLAREDEIDRLAIFVILDPEVRDLAVEEQLNELAGLEYGAALLVRGEW